jgi:hypothetical protein
MIEFWIAEVAVKNKPLKVLVGAAAFLAAFYVVRQAFDWVRREPAVPKEIAGKAWVENRLEGSPIVFEAPWRLQPEPINFPDEVARLLTSSQFLMHEENGLTVSAMRMSFLPGTPMSLEGAAEGTISGRGTPDTVSVKGSKRASILLGLPAFEVEARMERKRGGPLQMYGVVFYRGLDLYQFQLGGPADQPAALDSWKRLRESIRIRENE